MPGLNNARVAAASFMSATGLTGLDVTSQAWSFALWYWCAIGGYDIWGHGGTTATRDGVWLYTGTGASALVVGLGDATSNTYAIGPAGMLRVGMWAHYAIVWDGAGALFYRDGALMGRGVNAASITVTANGTRTTRTRGWSSGFCPGRFFDLRHFPNVLLTSGEVRQAMDPRRPFAPSMCKGRWVRNWKQGASGTIYDESGNGNNLTLSSTLLDALVCEEPPWRESLW